MPVIFCACSMRLLATNIRSLFRLGRHYHQCPLGLSKGFRALIVQALDQSGAAKAIFESNAFPKLIENRCKALLELTFLMGILPEFVQLV